LLIDIVISIVNFHSLDIHGLSQIYFPPGAYANKQEKFRAAFLKEMRMKIM